MKTHKIIFLSLAFFFSQAALSTGSDGGNSVPGAQPPESNSQTHFICIVNSITEEEHCFIIDENGNAAF